MQFFSCNCSDYRNYDTRCDTNPHVIVQPVHVRRTFHRMQSDGTMNLLLLEISGERLGSAAVVIKNRLHLYIIMSILWVHYHSFREYATISAINSHFIFITRYILIILNNLFLSHASLPFLLDLHLFNTHQRNHHQTWLLALLK